MKKIYYAAITNGQMAEINEAELSAEWNGDVAGYIANMDIDDATTCEPGVPGDIMQGFGLYDPENIHTLYHDGAPCEVWFSADDGQRYIWLARVADDNSDAYRAYYDKAEAEKMARSYFNHLTPKERMTHSVTVEGYIIPADDPRDAETLWRDLLLDDDPATYDPDICDVINAASE